MFTFIQCSKSDEKEETNKSLTLNDIFEVKNNKNIISNVSKLDNQENLLVKNEDKKVENILKIVTNPQISQDDDEDGIVMTTIMTTSTMAPTFVALESQIGFQAP